MIIIIMIMMMIMMIMMINDGEQVFLRYMYLKVVEK